MDSLAYFALRALVADLIFRDLRRAFTRAPTPAGYDLQSAALRRRYAAQMDHETAEFNARPFSP